MALIKHNNNSISAITALPSGITTGNLTLISEQTASSSASIEFTSGIDSTYDIYQFEFVNIHPATDNVNFTFNLSSDGGSNYNVTKTTTFFRAQHDEADTNTSLAYNGGRDLAQSTNYQIMTNGLGSDNDQSVAGTLQIFNPTSSVFVKHFIATMTNNGYNNFEINDYMAGYANTTSSINAVSFKMSSGNIDDGIIKMYGIK